MRHYYIIYKIRFSSTQNVKYGLRCAAVVILHFWYEPTVDTTIRILKEGEIDVVKLEGVSPSRITAAKAIVDAGIVVIGYVGVTPQAISLLGVFMPQGKTIISVVKVSPMCICILFI